MGLAAPAGEVVQGEGASSPAPPPAPDLWLGEADGLAGSGVAEMRGLIEEQGQAGALDEAMRGGPAADGVAGVLQEVLGEPRAVCGYRPWHVARSCRLANGVGQQARAL